MEDSASLPLSDAEEDHRLRKRSVTLAGHKTSLSLEAAFWDELKALARSRGLSINALVAEIDRNRRGNLSSAVRVYLLKELRNRQMPR
jgi:predicted DNA-binding ribbon-helix-helix protein